MNQADAVDKRINIVGAGLSGLSAAITLAEAGIACNLISLQASERAQSVLAEGGINAALDVMGENDSAEEHFADTMKGGVFLESESAVRNLTENAPDVVRKLIRLGVPFNSENGQIVQRNFGGQKKKRTAYAKSSTGKMIMTALIDEVRRYEAEGLVARFPHHELIDICTEDGGAEEGTLLKGIVVKDTYTDEIMVFSGAAILCSGGLNGFFEGLTTGTTQNSGNIAAIAFDRGVRFADLEFIQFHPTTVDISGKCMLISEAARGEGGRLWIMRDGKPWYFMEEKYPELGNLMPRDVVTRESVFAKNAPGAEGEVYLDLTGLDDDIWKTKLSDMREEIISYVHIDPAKDPVPVKPGIHFFMGGIRVDDSHRTNVKGIYAAGEAACKYHGANRLGANSMLGAIFGGMTAAKAVIGDAPETSAAEEAADIIGLTDLGECESDPYVRRKLRDILYTGLGIVRDEAGMEAARAEIKRMAEDASLSAIDRKRAMLGLAMADSALARKESRGSHYRTDFSDTSEEFRKISYAVMKNGEIVTGFADAADDTSYSIRGGRS